MIDRSTNVRVWLIGEQEGPEEARNDEGPKDKLLKLDRLYEIEAGDVDFSDTVNVTVKYLDIISHLSNVKNVKGILFQSRTTSLFWQSWMRSWINISQGRP